MIELQLMSAEDRERFENRDRENLRKKAFSQSGRTATCTPEQAAAMAEVARLRARAGITAAGRVCRTSHSPADERQALHEKAKRYQAEHPGTDYLAAVKAVASDSPAAISEEQIERQAMHEKAMRYQAEHPGTDYLAAVKAVASDSPAAISEEQIERQAMHENAKRYQAEHPGTDYLAAIIASSRS